MFQTVNNLNATDSKGEVRFFDLSTARFGRISPGRAFCPSKAFRCERAFQPEGLFSFSWYKLFDQRNLLTNEGFLAIETDDGRFISAINRETFNLCLLHHR
jgi:hypothetical protein